MGTFEFKMADKWGLNGGHFEFQDDGQRWVKVAKVIQSLEIYNIYLDTKTVHIASLMTKILII